MLFRSILQANGSVKVMGDNSTLAMGIGDDTASETDGIVLMSNRILTVGAGDRNAYAVIFATGQDDRTGTSVKVGSATGNIYGWGANDTQNGRPFQNVVTNSVVSTPVQLNVISSNGVQNNLPLTDREWVSRLSGGSTMTMVTTESALMMSGLASVGQQGGTSTTTGAKVSNSNVLSATSASGGYHSVYVNGTGNVYAMGAAAMEQLGTQDMLNTRSDSSQTILTVGGTFVIEGKVNSASIEMGEILNLGNNYTVSKGFNLLSKAQSIGLLEGSGYQVTTVSLDSDIAEVVAGTNSTSVRAKAPGVTDILLTVTDGITTRTVEFHLTVLKPYTYRNGTQENIAYAQVSVGEDYVLALKANGEVYSWGMNSYGVLGLGPASVNSFETKPQKVTFTSNRVDRYVDNTGRQLLLEDGIYYVADPADTSKKLLQETLDEDGITVIFVPVQVEARFVTAIYEEAKIVKIVAGPDFAMAIDTEGLLYTWGRNNNGQIGNGNVGDTSGLSQETYVSRPTVVESLGNLKSDSQVNYVKMADVFTGKIGRASCRERV